MDGVDIKLSREQYETLIEVLYFADFCVSSDLVSGFKDTDSKNRLLDVITVVNSCGDELDLPKTSSSTSIASEVRFSEAEALKRKQDVEHDLYNIAWNIVAYEFARRDLEPSLLSSESGDLPLCMKASGELNTRWVCKSAKKYKTEFKKNGFSNLRIKSFYKVSE